MWGMISEDISELKTFLKYQIVINILKGKMLIFWQHPLIFWADEGFHCNSLFCAIPYASVGFSLSCSGQGVLRKGGKELQCNYFCRNSCFSWQCQFLSSVGFLPFVLFFSLCWSCCFPRYFVLDVLSNFQLISAMAFICCLVLSYVLCVFILQAVTICLALPANQSLSCTEVS